MGARSCTPTALHSLRDFPIEAPANWLQQFPIVQPQHRLARFAINRYPAPLCARVRRYFNFPHPSSPSRNKPKIIRHIAERFQDHRILKFTRRLDHPSATYSTGTDKRARSIADLNLLVRHSRVERNNNRPHFPHSVKARTLRCRPKTVPQQSLEQNGTLRRRRPVSFPRTLVLVALWLRSVELLE